MTGLCENFKDNIAVMANSTYLKPRALLVRNMNYKHFIFIKHDYDVSILMSHLKDQTNQRRDITT